MALSFLGQTAQAHGDYGKAVLMLEEALALLNQNLDDKFAIASRLNELGSVARSQGDYTRATQLHEQALTIFREMDNKFAIAYALRHLGFTAFAQADYRQAVSKFEESLAIGNEASDPLEIAFALYGMGKVAQAQSDFTLARQLIIESITLFQEITNPADVIQGVSHCLEALAILAVTQKQRNRAICLFSMSERLYAPLIFELSAAERAEHEQAVAASRAALGEKAYKAAWEAGKQMSLDEAVTYALKEMQ
jgi:tetratricopeptide (TPR) repeat protein